MASSGLADWLAVHGAEGPWLALLVAGLMGLRHATDPDHLTAVSTLVLADRRRGARSAARHGLAWGLGHGATLFAFGLPVVLFGAYLPAPLQRLAEVAIGVVIVALAVRLHLRWRRGYFHSHPHRHGGVEHSHPHAHERVPPEHAWAAGAPAHEHPHAEDLGAGPLRAFGVGLLHGAGGSAAAGALLVAAVADAAAGAAALLLYAATTAAAMAAVSAGVGQALGRGWVGRRFEGAVPAFAAFGVLFGVWYAAAAF